MSMPEERQNVMLDAALDLLERGMHVIPLGDPQSPPPQSLVDRFDGDVEKARAQWPKTPRIAWKQYQTKAPTEDEVTQWWTQWPTANIGVCTGAVIVLDADSKEAADWLRNNVTPTPWRVKTGRKDGLHFWYGANPQLPIKNRADAGSKIDIRGYGGYVVVPPSKHANGQTYEWDVDRLWEADSIDDLPKLTHADIEKIQGLNRTVGTGNLNVDVSHIRPANQGQAVPQGERNTAAASLAGRYIRQGMDLATIQRLMEDWNARNPQPLAQGELRTTIASVAKTHTDNHPDSPIPLTPAETPQGGFEFIHARDILGAIGPTDWVIKHYIEANSVGLLFGDPGSYKSFLAIDMAACTATGKDWFGHKVKRPGPAYYIAGEGHNGLARRLKAWSDYHQAALWESPFYVSRRATQLYDPGAAIQVHAAVDQLLQQHGEAPSLIVIDTLARNFGPGNENATEDMNVFIEHVDRYLREPTGAAVLIVHHTGHAEKGRARGAMALKGAIDFEYQASKAEDGQVQVKCSKMKDAPEPDPFHVAATVVDLGMRDEDGAPITSLALVPGITVALGGDRAGLRGKALEALEVLEREYRVRREAAEDRGDDPEGVRVTVAEWRDACAHAGLLGDKFDTRRKAFARVRESLEKRHLVTVIGTRVYLGERVNN